MSNISSGYIKFTCSSKQKSEKAIKLIEQNKSINRHGCLDISGPIKRGKKYEIGIQFSGDWGVTDACESLSEIFTKVDTDLNYSDPIFEGDGYEYEFGQMSFCRLTLDYEEYDDDKYRYIINTDDVYDGADMVEFLKDMSDDPVGWVFEEGGGIAVSFIQDFPEAAKELDMINEIKKCDENFINEVQEELEELEIEWENFQVGV